MNVIPPGHRFCEIGGRLCLDFCNTVGGSASHPTEHIGAYGDLLEFSAQKRFLDPTWRTAADADPRAAAAVTERALRLRDALRRILFARLDRKIPPAADLALVDQEAARA